ncbi:MAG: DNA mismatch repair protein MutS [Gemmatimonadetes bacterium]|nr:DNA mismatch repair protein MutS [Gemmatimonadota bacterium]MXV97063.1 DNA mismatch repair protein MutS [Gemmatimonadota bacterium]MYE16187.1 DNA mismatch repair protein MutS [Gemmatimonadota bacterium]
MQHHGRREGAASTSPAATYAERAQRFDKEAAERLGRVRVYGRLRLAVFGAAVAGAWWLFASARGGAAWPLLAAAAFVFAVLVARQRAARRRMRRSELMADFNREGIARVERRWADLPSVPGATAARDHDYAVDLDLYGDASLLQLLGVCGTAPGWTTLQAWMLGGADADEIALRQEAVLEMAGALDFRDRLAAEGRLVASGDSGDTDASADRFLRWAEGDSWLQGQRWLRIAGLVLAPINVAAITLVSLGAVPTPVMAWPLVISALVLVPTWKTMHAVFAEADDGESGVRQFGPLLRHIHNASLRSRHAVAIRHRLGAGPRVAHEEMNVLRRLLDMADVRRSPLFHIPLALVLHWDVHVLVALERWKERSGHRVGDWLDATGEAEALAALAALAADHPDWTMPALDPDAHTVEARALGHPLIAPGICIRNDVEIGPAGSFLLVTGSNMSGKSTLLRALGLNAVLAQAGGPVCAARLRMPPLRVVTSMRVDDSLAEGVSYFMAGLQRLKMVVEAARSPGGVTPRTLYLLDEILQGTNSAERRVAARTVLRHLLETDAIGAVTTHDLSLAEADDLTTRGVAVHFTESVDDGAEGLAFDYRLRSGIAKSTNALKLLEMAGLGGSPR